MTVVMTNTYKILEDKTWQQLVTGLLGVFDDHEKAESAWNEALKKLGVPDDDFKDYAPEDGLRHAIISVDADGKYVDGFDDNEAYIIEFMWKDTELNKVLGPDD